LSNEVKKCKRCGKEFDDPVPLVTNPSGYHTEICTDKWCPGCNRIGIIPIHRKASVYYVSTPKDPLRGGQ